MINGLKGRQGSSFHQSDVDRGFVSYHHDHSDSHRDQFGIDIFLEGDRNEIMHADGRTINGDILLFSGIWNITVLQVNDQVRIIKRI